MEHKMITDAFDVATKEINKYLFNGWYVVPGTVAMRTDKGTKTLMLTATIVKTK
jgi:hypothetical protein